MFLRAEAQSKQVTRCKSIRAPGGLTLVVVSVCRSHYISIDPQTEVDASSLGVQLNNTPVLQLVLQQSEKQVVCVRAGIWVCVCVRETVIWVNCVELTTMEGLP